MLDVKRFREDFDGVKAALAKRHKDYHLEKFTELDEKRRDAAAKRPYAPPNRAKTIASLHNALPLSVSPFVCFRKKRGAIPPFFICIYNSIATFLQNLNAFFVNLA